MTDLARGEYGKLCRPNLNTVGRYSSVVYSPADQLIWQDFFSSHETFLRDHGHSSLLSGFRLLCMTPTVPLRLSEIDQTLNQHTGWRVVEVDGMVPQPQYFDLLAKGVFPVSRCLRPGDVFFPWPDLIHDLFHVALLFDPFYRKLLRLVGLLGTQAQRRQEKEMFLMLEKFYWYLIEYGMVEGGRNQFYGATLSSYLGEARFVLSKPELLAPAELPKVLNMPFPWELNPQYSLERFQTMYFYAAGFKELYFDLWAWAKLRIPDFDDSSCVLSDSFSNG